MKSKKDILLWVGWALACTVAVACFAVLLQGVARDMRWGGPAIPVDFSKASGWQSESFRVWGEDTYTLFVSSVNHDPEYVGRFLAANFRTGTGIRSRVERPKVATDRHRCAHPRSRFGVRAVTGLTPPSYSSRL